MSATAHRKAFHRRALWGGTAISVAAHAVALVAIVVPGHTPGAGTDKEMEEVFQDDFDALELVALTEPTPPTTTPVVTVPDAFSTADATGEVAREATPETPSLEARLASLQPAQMSVDLPDRSRPVITFSDLEPVGDPAAMAAAYAYAELLAEQEGEEGGLSGFLSKIGAALSGGGHCPTPATADGPLILR